MLRGGHSQTPKRAESPTLYSPIRKGWVSVGQKDKNTLAHNPEGVCRRNSLTC